MVNGLEKRCNVPLYNVEVHLIGRMTIMHAKTRAEAVKRAHEEYGNLVTVTPATPKDVAWYNAMSGRSNPNEKCSNCPGA